MKFAWKMFAGIAIFYQHVTVYFCRSIQMINNKVKVSIIIQVCITGSIGKTFFCKAPVI